MCYMAEHPARVGVRELRQNLSVYLERVRAGERLEVTDRGHPVAFLVPATRKGLIEGLKASGRLTVAAGDLLDLGATLAVNQHAISASARLRADGVV